MQTASHTIRKFSLELQLGKGADHYRLQRNTADLIKEKLVQELDGLLTGYFPGEDYIRLSRIEIDLGTIRPGAFDSVFVDSCIQQLKARLQSLRITGSTKSTDDIHAVQVPKAVNTIQQFMYFLANGTLPVPPAPATATSRERQIIEAIHANTADFTALLPAYAPYHRAMADRLVNQFAPAFIYELVNMLAPPCNVLLQDVLRHLQAIQDTTLLTSLRKRVLAALFYAILQYRSQQAVASLQALLIWLQQAIKTPLVLQTMKEVPQQLDNLIRVIADSSVALFVPAATPVKDNQPEQSVQKQPDETVNQIPAPSTAGIFIDNAGLVLLHPFLSNLFIALDLMQDSQFISEEAQHKAVHLLQFLVNGEEEAPEYNLAFNKLLCGLREDQHIDRFIALSQEEKQEAHELLQAVVTHWTALKSSSPEALQEIFLQRKGKLSFIETENYWKLQVEQKAFDILLDKLPWGFSYIQLSWMQYPLMTEWQ